MVDTIQPAETVIKSIEHIVTTTQNLKPALDFIHKHRPEPSSIEWSPTSDSKVFRFKNYWVVRQIRPQADVRNKTDLYIRDDARQLYVMWSSLDNNPNDAQQLSIMIAEHPNDKNTMVCFDGENKLTDSYTSLNYVNTLLTYSF